MLETFFLPCENLYVNYNILKSVYVVYSTLWEVAAFYLSVILVRCQVRTISPLCFVHFCEENLLERKQKLNKNRPSSNCGLNTICRCSEPFYRNRHPMAHGKYERPMTDSHVVCDVVYYEGVSLKKYLMAQHKLVCIIKSKFQSKISKIKSRFESLSNFYFAIEKLRSAPENIH